MGVVSKSKGTSIKVFNGRTRYDQWAVTYQDIKPGKGLPPDLIQALNVPAGQAQPGGVGRPAQPGANPFGAQPGGVGQPRSPFGPPGANPFGQPGVNPPMAPPGGSPFGRPGTNPFGGAPGPIPPGGAGPAPPANPFAPAYPPPPGAAGSIFGGPPPRKTP
jgi:hypothetical protein